MGAGADLDRLGGEWDQLRERVGGRLLRVESPLAPCQQDLGSRACGAVLEQLRNPFFGAEQPGGFQTTGWLGAFVAEPSAYAVAATSADDVVAAVAFAGVQGVRLVIKNTGHDYLGRCGAPESLLVWMHPMRAVTIHDEFRIAGGQDALGVPAVTVEAGARWLEVYQEAARHGRYVQGGGCTTVGAAGGFTQGGGFGSFSRRFGTAAGNVLELEVVTASGEVLVVNEAQHPDLFWALRGGGGGTFGVVVRLTMRTHPLPQTLVGAFGTITAASDTDYRRLVDELVRFCPDLANEHWGEQIQLGPDNALHVAMVAVDLDEHEAQDTWTALRDWVGDRGEAFSSDLMVAGGPFEGFWDPDWWEQLAPGMIRRDDRPGQPPGRFWWATNQGEVSQYLNAYQSRWLPLACFKHTPDSLGDALYQASRHHHYSLHLNKALAGAHPDAVARDRSTSINAAAFDAVALLIMASNQQDVYPGVPGREPDYDTGAAEANRIDTAMHLIRNATPGAGAYVNEANYFETDWQETFWGSNYQRLLEIKRRYDPGNLFRVHHGVGSEVST